MKRMMGLVAVAAMMTAVPALAAPAPVTIKFSGSSLVNGIDGNPLVFSKTADGTTVKVRATGWSLDRGVVRDSFLGAYGAGLGVTSGDELGLGNTHVIDNQNRNDFVLLQFDQAVQLTSAVFNGYSLGGGTDTDATIAWGTLSSAWNTKLALNNVSAATLASMFSGSALSLGNSSGGSRSLGLSGATGNFWLIGAAFVNADKKIDGFKLGSVTLKTVAPVPEPSTWAMMLVGFGLVAAAMRGAIRTSEQRFTDKVRAIANAG